MLALFILRSVRELSLFLPPSLFEERQAPCAAAAMSPDRDASLLRFVVEVVDVNGAWAGVEQVKER